MMLGIMRTSLQEEHLSIERKVTPMELERALMGTQQGMASSG